MGARTHVMIVVFAVLAFFAASPIAANAAGEDYAKAAKVAIPYTVIISTDKPLGSGFIVKSGEAYYVVTFTVVAGDNKTVTITMNDGKTYQAELRGTSPGAGVTVFKMTDAKGEIPSATFATSEKLDVGEKIIVVGAVQDYGICVTSGIISGIYDVDAGNGQKIKCIQTDAEINQDQLGGPVVNLDGLVVGMCVNFSAVQQQEQPQQPQGRWGRRGPRTDQGQAAPQSALGIALPSESIQDAVKQAIRMGGVLATVNDFGFNGLQDVNAATMQQLKLTKAEGALVINVVKDSPLDKAGIKPNDVILEFNGKPVANSDDLRSLAQTVTMGAKVKVKYVGMREGKITSASVDVQLAKAQADDGGISNEAPPGEGEVVQNETDSAVLSAPAGEGMLITSAAGEAGAYVAAVNRISQSLVMMANGGTAILLPKTIGGNDTTRYLITAAHLVPNKQVKLAFYKGQGDAREQVMVDGEVIGTDPKNDLAVIKVSVSGAPDQLGMVKMADIDYATEVIAVGQGPNAAPQATAGVLSIKNFCPRDGVGSGFCAASALVSAANDGGALVDRSGGFVGMCTSMDNYYSANKVSLVVPAETAFAVARQLITKGKVATAYLGLETSRDLTREEMMQRRLGNGVAIVKVTKGGPAEKAGLAEKQIIIRFGNTVVINKEHLTALVTGSDVGKKVNITYVDELGKSITVEVELTEKSE